MGWGGERRQSSAKKCNLLQYKGSSLLLSARLMAGPESSCTFALSAAIFLGLNIVSDDDDLEP